MIHAKDLCFRYAEDTPFALENITLHAPEGSLLCLCGINGSGKSTLLSLLAGLATPTTGQLSIAGTNAVKQEHILRKLSALVLQDADMQIIGSTVEEDMLLAFPQSQKDAPECAKAMAARFGISEHWNSPVQSLSYGQKRKLCLAVAQLANPKVLLLDEPFSGLDYPAIMEMRSLLKENKAKGLTQVISVHDLEPLADLIDQLVVLNKGSQVLAGPPAETLDFIRQYGVRPPCSWQERRTITEWK